MKKWILVLLAAVLLWGCVPAEKAAQPVRIAVIDTGFSSLAIPSENVAEGKNYLDPEASTEDTYGHGTAVASVILQYAPEAILIPLVSNAYEKGKITQVSNDMFAQMIRDSVDIYHCQIINISAGLVLDKPEVGEAVAYAESKGALVVASAGNDYRENPGQKYYPAGYDTVVAVGALEKGNKEIAPYSQRGAWVDFYAPGTEVTIRTLSGNTRTDSGTSYGCAYVCAKAALYLRDNPRAGAEQVRQHLQQIAVSLPGGQLAIP